MQEPLTTTHKKMQSPHCFYHVHVDNKDATYNTRFKPDLLCIKELPHQSTPPLNLADNLTVQFVEFTYTTDRFSKDTVKNKIHKYQPLINNIN